MSRNELVPLEKVKGFTEPIRKQLAGYWITTAEEFAGATRWSSGNRIATLSDLLQITPDQVTALRDAAELAAPRAKDFAVMPDVDYGTGLLLDENPPPVERDFGAAAAILPPSVNHAAALPEPGFQGLKRNTCVAFASIALFQLAAHIQDDLSEQFLFCLCKANDGYPNLATGTLPYVAFEMLKKYGVCAEADWPYNQIPMPGNVGQGPPPPGAEAAARSWRIGAYKPLEQSNINVLKNELFEGRAVLIGAAYYPYWSKSGQAAKLGRIRMPLPDEVNPGGHAMCVVGYQDDPAAPGGGYFIVRNSWDTSWGEENPTAPGYCYVPYEYVKHSTLVSSRAYSITAVHPNTLAALRARGETAGAAVASAADDPDPLLREINSLLARAGSDAARMAELAGQARELADRSRGDLERLAQLIEQLKGRKA